MIKNLIGMKSVFIFERHKNQKISFLMKFILNRWEKDGRILSFQSKFAILNLYIFYRIERL